MGCGASRTANEQKGAESPCTRQPNDAFSPCIGQRDPSAPQGAAAGAACPRTTCPAGKENKGCEPEEGKAKKRKKVVIVEYRVALLCPESSPMPKILAQAVKECAYKSVLDFDTYHSVEKFRKKLGQVNGGNNGKWEDNTPDSKDMQPAEPPTSDYSVVMIEHEKDSAYSAVKEALEVRRLHKAIPIGIISSEEAAAVEQQSSTFAADNLKEICVLQNLDVESQVCTDAVRFSLHGLLLRTKNRWVKGPLPEDEDRRIAALEGLKILDTDVERRIDEYVLLARRMFNTQFAMVSLIDRKRQWFKAQRGLDTSETPRDQAFCAHAVYQREPLTVEDTHEDPRFADNPLVRGSPHLRFYSGTPLFLPDGSCIGTLCVADTRPRAWLSSDALSLSTLGLGVTGEILRNSTGT